MPEYRAIDTPTLILPGEQDRVIPTWVQPIAGSGHVVYLEKPDAFFDHLKRFTQARSAAY